MPKKNQEVRTFMHTHWYTLEDGAYTVGINDDGVNEILSINALHLPAVHDSVDAEEICGEIDTDDGPFNLYSPCSGTVIEINDTIVENPALVLEDSMAEGWLFKIEPTDEDDEDEDEDLDEDDEEEADEED